MRTFPTNNCVRVSRPGIASEGRDEAIAICMTASMSSLEGGIVGEDSLLELNEGSFTGGVW